MEWVSEGIIIAFKDYANDQAIISVFTEKHGRCQGLLYGGRSKSNRAAVQIGNVVQATWKSRLENQLGYFVLELQQDNSLHVFQNFWACYITAAAAELIYRLFPERQAHLHTYKIMQQLLQCLTQPLSLVVSEYIKWETALLADIGYGLDLKRCAVTGQMNDLNYVSPKTGRAVSKAVAQEWIARLLVLPSFLQEDKVNDGGKAPQPLKAEELLHGLDLTGFFLEKYALAEFSSPFRLQARDRLVNMVKTNILSCKEAVVSGIGIKT